jgi:hypothetical protein
VESPWLQHPNFVRHLNDPLNARGFLGALAFGL